MTLLGGSLPPWPSCSSIPGPGVLPGPQAGNWSHETSVPPSSTCPPAPSPVSQVSAHVSIGPPLAPDHGVWALMTSEHQFPSLSLPQKGLSPPLPLFFFSHITREEVSPFLSMTTLSNYPAYHVHSCFKNTNTVYYITFCNQLRCH